MYIAWQVEVCDNWAGGPGAAVIAAGKSSTRENRLIAWAEDIEALVTSQVGMPAAGQECRYQGFHATQQ